MCVCGSVCLCVESESEKTLDILTRAKNFVGKNHQTRNTMERKGRYIDNTEKYLVI